MFHVVILTLAFMTLLPLQSTAQATTTFTLLCDAKVPTAPADPATTIRKMEATYLDQTYGFGVGCWAHVGIQQYFIGVDRIYTLQGATLSARMTEQLQSPPAEGSPTVGHVYVETSMDGITWDPLTTMTPMSSGATKTVTLSGLNKDFRFIRGREPVSITNGLSGYLDYFYGSVTVVDAGAAPVLTPAGLNLTQSFSCRTDIMEDPVASSPCSYGGLEHYDSWSAFHTYFLGDARLDSIHVDAKLGFVRYTDPLGIEPPPTGAIDGQFWIQTSVDGRTWTTQAIVSMTYEVGTNHTVGGLNDLEAKFVRLNAGRHPSFDDRYQFGTNAPLRRTEGYFQDSGLVLTGEFL